MEILSPGEKIKKIRKTLKISQKDLANGIISEPMLSYIENNKLNLSKKIAKLLCQKINAIMNEEFMKIENILETEKEQAEYIIIETIKNLNNYSINDFKNMKFNIEKYANIEDSIKYNSIIGSFLYNKFKNMGDSLFFLESILDNAIKIKSNFLGLIILQLQRIYNKNRLWKKSINLYNILNIEKWPEKEIKNYIIFNFGLAFHKEGIYGKSIELYKYSYSFGKKLIIKESSLNNIGFCYILSKNFIEAINYFISSSNENRSYFNLTLCYSNLILCGIRTNNIIIIKNNIMKLETNIEYVSKDKKYQSFMALGEGYNYLNDRYNSIINFEKEIGLGMNIKDHHFLIEKYIHTIIELLKLYTNADLKKLKKLEQAIFDIPKESLSNRELIEIIEVYSNKFPKNFKNFISNFKNYM